MDGSVSAPVTPEPRLEEARLLIAYLRDHAADEVGDVSEQLRRDVIAMRAEGAAGLCRSTMVRAYATAALGFVIDGDDDAARAAAILAANVSATRRAHDASGPVPVPAGVSGGSPSC